MRARHPDLFSDSELTQKPVLPEAVFEYYLDTLTSRKQEYEFEHFARKLAEKEICPNLIPQTGPTGGGDGKVDTETYPVSEQISALWYQGSTEAAGERWAFAVSAKKKWKEKVKADVEKIVDTDRGYKRIYFISSQYIKASTRSALEDELTAKYSIPVTIFDRTWIKECVYEHDRLQLAIETLNISGFDHSSESKKGKLDIAREQELNELENQIRDVYRYRWLEYQLAEDCLHAALLARGLARPRTDIDGMFVRAERIAKKANHPQQRLRIAYKKAWTTYWWFEDLEEFNSLYDDVEELVSDSVSADDLEMLFNLHTVLTTNVRWGEIDPVKAKLEHRTDFLTSKLEIIAADKTRPNNALSARTHLAFKKLGDARFNSEPIDKYLEELNIILTEVQGLAAYSFESTIEVILELGQYLNDNEAYDDLFETIVKLREDRAGKAEVGQMLLRRGYQKQRAGKHYDAIKMLGRAQQFLANRENRAEFIAALYGCGVAYESVGLLWAARANTLAAINQANSEFTATGKFPPTIICYLKRLVWLEIQLGRVPCVLEWIQTTDAITRYVLSEERQFDKYFEERNSQDAVLSILLLKTDFWELKWLGFLPEILDKMKLYDSWAALLYVLGYEDRLREEKFIPEGKDANYAKDLFIKLLEQPANKDLPTQPEFLRGRTVTFRSNVMGCDISVTLPNERNSIYLAETILGALESLFATCIQCRMFSHRADFKINVRTSLVKNLDYEFKIVDDEEQLVVSHSPTLFEGHSNTAVIYDWLSELIIHIGARLFIIESPEEFARRLFGEESGMGRAINFSQVAIPLENILGDSPRVTLADWNTEDIEEKFPLKRTVSWNDGVIDEKIDEKKKISELIAESGSTATKDFDTDNYKHTDLKTSSIINISLWDRAGWSGMVYMYDAEDPNVMPLVGFGFKDIEAGKAIFRGWRKKLGKHDDDEQIRISFITGIDKQKPASYKVMVSSNPSVVPQKPSNRFFTLVSRFQRMDPSSTENLDTFLKNFKRIEKYAMVPVRYISDTDVSASLNLDLLIIKSELFIKPAWQINENSPEVASILEDDELIIPGDVNAAEVLKRLKKFHSPRKST